MRADEQIPCLRLGWFITMRDVNVDEPWSHCLQCEKTECEREREEKRR